MSKYFNKSEYSNFDDLIEYICIKNNINIKRNWNKHTNNVFITNIEDVTRIDSNYLDNLSKFSTLFNKNIEFRSWNYYKEM